MSLIKDILKNKSNEQTIYSLTEIQNLSPNYNGPKLNSSLKYLVKKGDLMRVTKGLYALDGNYSRIEFGNKFRIPSYVSFYTVLQEANIIFQPYSTIFLASNRSEKKEINKQAYVYRKIKDEILLNPFGIEIINGVFMATPERALCDKLYLDGPEYFDNLRSIDKSKIIKINSEVFNNNKYIKKWISRNIK